LTSSCYEAASRAYAALIALDPVLASRGLLEGCRREWRVEPGRFWAGRGLEALQPRARLAAVAAAAARAAALRDLAGEPVDAGLLVAALEAYAASVLKRLRLPPAHPLHVRLLLSIAAPSPASPGEALAALSASLSSGGLRGAAARLLVRLLRPRAALIDRGPGRGRSGPVGGETGEGGGGDGVGVEELARLAAAGYRWRRSFLRPPKRLSALPADVVVPGSDRVRGSLYFMLDVSASMRPGEVARGLAVAEALWRLVPAPERRLILFDYGVRASLSSPGEAREEHLTPWGGTSLSRALAEAGLAGRPCTGLLVVYSDWGLSEDDAGEALRVLRRLAAGGCTVALMGPREPPRGPWISLPPRRPD